MARIDFLRPSPFHDRSLISGRLIRLDRMGQAIWGLWKGNVFGVVSEVVGLGIRMGMGMVFIINSA